LPGNPWLPPSCWKQNIRETVKFSWKGHVQTECHLRPDGGLARNSGQSAFVKIKARMFPLKGESSPPRTANVKIHRELFSSLSDSSPNSLLL
jgi:hypothetical protein